MFLEIAKPVALVLCLLSLCAVFNAAFLTPSLDVENRILASLDRLAIAAGIAMVGALIFRFARDGRTVKEAPLGATLPAQIFCWTTGAMLVLFVIAWYLETHVVFYRRIGS